MTSDGGYILGGYTHSFGNGGNDYWLVKTNSAGVEEWNQTYGGSGEELCSEVKQTSDNGYIMVGRTSSNGNHDIIWLVKTNSEGVEEWNQTYGGGDDAYGQSIQQTSDGGYIIIGRIGSTENNTNNIWLIKTNSEGVEEWNQTYGGADDAYGQSIQQTSDGGFILVGYTFSLGLGADVFLIKTDSEGVEEWNQTYGGMSADAGFSVQQTTNGGYILGGYTESFGNSRHDFWLVKTNSEGVEEWNQTFGGSQDDICWEVQQTLDNGYIMVGETKSAGNVSNGHPNIWLIKTNSEGILQWSQTYGTIAYDAGYSVKQTLDNGFIVLGATLSFADDKDFWLIKTDPYGNTTPY